MENYFNLNSKMNDVETKLPAIRTVLHSQFHIGGCTKCGYEPQNTIEEVAQKYSKEPLTLLESINQAYEEMNCAEISISEFAQILSTTNEILILDVREDWEFNIAHIPNSNLLTEANFENMIAKAKSVLYVVVVCHHGMRSMNATLYLRENGVRHAKSLQGGIDAYSLQIDRTCQRY